MNILNISLRVFVLRLNQIFTKNLFKRYTILNKVLKMITERLLRYVQSYIMVVKIVNIRCINSTLLLTLMYMFYAS